MRPTALTLAEMGGPAARRETRAPASVVPHRWIAHRCARCSMLDSWAGAQYACVGTQGRCQHVSARGVTCKRKADASGVCQTHRGKP